MQTPVFRPRLALAAAVALALGACASAPPKSALLGEAHATYERVQAAPEVSAQAALELQQAKQTLDAADSAQAARAKPEVVDHLAYLARQRALIAEQRAARKIADQKVANSEGDRTRIQLGARELEAQRARQSAAQSQARAEGAQRDAQSARASAAQAESELAALQAKRTERGLVVSLGNDVMFDTGKAELKSGASRALDRLAQFMQSHPERSVLIEGFTDSTGSDQLNLELSRRRAEAVRTALVARGISADRVNSTGYGEQYSIASNADAGGRQLNRRVEVVISDESGRIASR